jgi:hypothetical protein
MSLASSVAKSLSTTVAKYARQKARLMPKNFMVPDPRRIAGRVSPTGNVCPTIPNTEIDESWNEADYKSFCYAHGIKFSKSFFEQEVASTSTEIFYDHEDLLAMKHAFKN